MPSDSSSHARHLARANRIAADALRGVPLPDLMRAVVELVRDALGVERGAVIELGPRGVCVRALVGDDPARIDVWIPAEGTMTDDALRVDRPIIIPDLDAHPGYPGSPLRESGARSALVVVIRGANGPWGVLGAFDPAPRAFGAEDVEILQILANVLAAALQRAAGEAAVLATRAELAAVLDGVMDSVVAQRADGEIVFANVEAARVFGLPGPKEVIGRQGTAFLPRFAIFDEDGKPFPPERLPNRLALAGRAAEAVVVYRRVDATEDRAVQLRSHPVLDEAGNVRLVVSVHRDITAELRRARSDRFLARASAMLSESLEPSGTLDRIVALGAGEIADTCSVRLLSADGAWLELAAYAHRDPEFGARWREHGDHLRWPVRPPMGLVRRLLAGEPVLFRHLDESTLTETALPPAYRAAVRAVQCVSAALVPIRARGRFLGVILFANDVSGRLLDEGDLAVASALADRAGAALDNAALFEASRAARERLEVTLGSIAEGVVATDADGRVQTLNAVAEALTGWTEAEARGRPLDEVLQLVDARTRQPAPTPVAEVLRVGQVVVLPPHTSILARGGPCREITGSVAPIRGGAAVGAGVVLVFGDVTEQRLREREMERMGRLDSLGVLAGGIAHDFNNLLAAIVGNLSLVEEEVPEGHPALRRLKAASIAADRARDVTRQLLTFARGGAPVRGATDLPSLLSDTCAFTLQGSRSRVELAIAPDLFPALVDAGQMSQVVQNLLLNADQAMTAGGRVRVSAENEIVSERSGLPLAPGRYVRIVVADEGPGIRSEHVGRVFDPFFTTKPSGAGLGLATVYSIVRRHDGHVSVDPGSGTGARFTVRIPAADDAPPVPTAAPRVTRSTGRVLVMDDAPMIRDVAVACLDRLGYEAEAVADGATAVARYASARAAGRPFRAVLLDLTVPGAMGGLACIAALRAIDPDVRAIVSSGYSNDAILSRPSDHGFAGVLRKPYRFDELATTLSRVLGGG